MESRRGFTTFYRRFAYALSVADGQCCLRREELPVPESGGSRECGGAVNAASQKDDYEDEKER